MIHVLIALAGGVATFAVVYWVGIRMVRGLERIELEEGDE